MKIPSYLKYQPRKPKADKAVKPAKEAAKRQVPVPSFAEDLYRDMRDRRLLLPALALIVAIVAVPVLLTAPKEPAPPAAAVAVPEGSEAVAPAVLTEQPVGVRDYRERLDQLKSKNPFADDFQFPDAAGGTDPVAVDSGTSSSGPTTTNVPTLPDISSDVDGTTVPPAPTTSDSSVDNELLILAPRIDVRGGPVGKRKRIKDVAPGDLVPDQRKAPIAMFVGVSHDLKSATFVVSSDVTDTEGDGKCRPRANHCEFLTLREHEKRYFTFGPDAERFSLKLTDIREKIVDRRKVEGASVPSGTG